MSTSLYNHTRLTETVTLQPFQLDGNLEAYLLQALEKKVKRQMVPSGMVMEVEEIVSYSGGEINRANFMGLATYDLEYNAVVCSPVVNMQLPVKVVEIVPGYLKAEIGPISVYCESARSDTSYFSVSDDARPIWIETGKAVEPGDIVMVTLDRIRNSTAVLGHLIGPSNQAELDRYSANGKRKVDLSNLEFI